MSNDQQLGEIAQTVTTSGDAGAAKVVTGAADAAGAVQGAVAAEKFKQHKDNPTQRPG